MSKKENAPCQLPHQHGASAETRKTAPDDFSTHGANPLYCCPSAQRSCAESWIKANSRLWSEVVRLAKVEASEKRRFSLRSLMAMARYRGAVIPGGDVFKVNNNAIPALARLLMEEHPEVVPFIETRRASCDWSFGGGDGE